jgi:hypothetical protein
LLVGGAAVICLVAWNIVGLSQTALWLIRFGGGGDWELFSNLRVDDPYAAGAFRWAPPMAWFWVVLVVPLGLTAWQLAHVGGLVLFLDWRVVLVAVASWGFWQDVANGNILVFVVLAAWWALRGNAIGVIAFVTLAILVPRPIMLPVLLTLLWRHRYARVWFLLGAAALIGFSLYVGHLDDWIRRLFASVDEMSVIWNIGPSRIMGPLWIVLGLSLGVVLWRAGWLGLASIAVSPYLFPYYLSFALLDVPKAIELLRASEPGRKLAGAVAGRVRAARPSPASPA